MTTVTLLALFVGLITLVFLYWKRLLAVGLGWLCRRRHVRVTASRVYWMGVDDFCIQFDKGPVASLRVGSAALSADAGWVSALLSGTPRLPLRVRSVQVALDLSRPSAKDQECRLQAGTVPAERDLGETYRGLAKNGKPGNRAAPVAEPSAEDSALSQPPELTPSPFFSAPLPPLPAPGPRARAAGMLSVWTVLPWFPLEVSDVAAYEAASGVALELRSLSLDLLGEHRLALQGLSVSVPEAESSAPALRACQASAETLVDAETQDASFSEERPAPLLDAPPSRSPLFGPGAVCLSVPALLVSHAPHGAPLPALGSLSLAVDALEASADGLALLRAAAARRNDRAAASAAASAPPPPALPRQPAPPPLLQKPWLPRALELRLGLAAVSLRLPGSKLCARVRGASLCVQGSEAEGGEAGGLQAALQVAETCVELGAGGGASARPDPVSPLTVSPAAAMGAQVGEVAFAVAVRPLDQALRRTLLFRGDATLGACARVVLRPSGLASVVEAIVKDAGGGKDARGDAEHRPLPREQHSRCSDNPKSKTRVHWTLALAAPAGLCVEIESSPELRGASDAEPCEAPRVEVDADSRVPRRWTLEADSAQLSGEARRAVQFAAPLLRLGREHRSADPQGHWPPRPADPARPASAGGCLMDLAALEVRRTQERAPSAARGLYDRSVAIKIRGPTLLLDAAEFERLAEDLLPLFDVAVGVMRLLAARRRNRAEGAKGGAENDDPSAVYDADEPDADSYSLPTPARLRRPYEQRSTQHEVSASVSDALLLLPGWHDVDQSEAPKSTLARGTVAALTLGFAACDVSRARAGGRRGSLLHRVHSIRLQSVGLAAAFGPVEEAAAARLPAPPALCEAAAAAARSGEPCWRGPAHRAAWGEDRAAGADVGEGGGEPLPPACSSSSAGPSPSDARRSAPPAVKRLGHLSTLCVDVGHERAPGRPGTQLVVGAISVCADPDAALALAAGAGACAAVGRGVRSAWLAAQAPASADGAPEPSTRAALAERGLPRKLARWARLPLAASLASVEVVLPLDPLARSLEWTLEGLEADAVFQRELGLTSDEQGPEEAGEPLLDGTLSTSASSAAMALRMGGRPVLQWARCEVQARQRLHPGAESGSCEAEQAPPAERSRRGARAPPSARLPPPLLAPLEPEGGPPQARQSVGDAAEELAAEERGQEQGQAEPEPGEAGPEPPTPGAATPAPPARAPPPAAAPSPESAQHVSPGAPRRVALPGAPAGARAYARLGLEAWAAAAAAASGGSALRPAPAEPSAAPTAGPRPSAREASNSAARALGAGAAEILGGGPGAWVAVALEDPRVVVAHDRDPGPTARLAQLHVRALLGELRRAWRGGRAELSGPAEEAGGGRGERAASLPDSFSASAPRLPAPPAPAALDPLAPPPSPILVSLRVSSFALTFEHHPLEAWLARAAPSLLRAQAARHAWEEALGQVRAADAAARAQAQAWARRPPSAGAQAGVQAADRAAWERAMAEVCRAHAARMREGDAAGEGGAWEAEVGGAWSAAALDDPAAQSAWLSASSQPSFLPPLSEPSSLPSTPSFCRPPPPAPPPVPALQVRLRGARAACVWLPPCGARPQKAAALARRWDASHSEGAVFQRALLALADVDCLGLEVGLGGRAAAGGEPGRAGMELVSLRAAQVFGPLVLARAAALPPERARRPVRLGSGAGAVLSVPRRGASPPWKVYTDVRGAAAGLCVSFGPAMEASLAVAALAGKRLASSDPYFARAAPTPAVPWWDDVRYMWRGAARLRVADFLLRLGSPDVGPRDARMEVGARRLGARLEAGRARASLRGVQGQLLTPGGLQDARQGLLALPLLDLPRAEVDARLRWALPQGRDGQRHHLHEECLRAGARGQQRPCFPGVAFKAQAADLTLDVDLGEGGGPWDEEEEEADDATEPASAASASLPPPPSRFPAETCLPAPPPRGSSAPPPPRLYVGDHHIQWFKRWIEALKAPDAGSRAVVRRGTFFARKPRGVPPKRSLARLLRALRVGIAAPELEAVHSARARNDPSQGLTVAARAAFGCRLLANRPLHAADAAPAPLPHEGGADFALLLEGVRVLLAPPERRARAPFPGGGGGPEEGEGAGGAAGVEGRAPRKAAVASSDLPASPDAEAAALLRETLREGSPEPASPLLQHLSNDRGGRAPEGGGAATARSVVVRRAGGRGMEGFGPGGWARAGARARRGGEVPASESPAFLEDFPLSPTPPASWVPGEPRTSPEPASSPSKRPEPRLRVDLPDEAPPRPIHVHADSLQIRVDLRSRDAIWGAVQHLVSGVLSSPRAAHRAQREFRRQQARAAAAPSLLGASSEQEARLPWEGGPAAEEEAGEGSGDARVGRAEEGGELLHLLLEQQQQVAASEGGGGGENSAPGTRRELPSSSSPRAESSMRSEEGWDASEGEEGEAQAMASSIDAADTRLRYEVLATRLQVCLEAPGAVGRFLLAADSARLQGRSVPEGGLALTQLLLEHGQAFAAQLDVDPAAEAGWLSPRDEGGFAGAAPDSALRRVFNPFQLALWYSKILHSSDGARRAYSFTGGAPPSAGSAAAAASSLRGEELVLQVPELVVSLDSREFEVLVDVASLLLSAGPSLPSVGADLTLLRDAIAEGAPAEAHQGFARARQSLLAARALAAELEQVARGGGGEHLSPLLTGPLPAYVETLLPGPALSPRALAHANVPVTAGEILSATRRMLYPGTPGGAGSAAPSAGPLESGEAAAWASGDQALAGLHRRRSASGDLAHEAQHASSPPASAGGGASAGSLNSLAGADGPLQSHASGSLAAAAGGVARPRASPPSRSASGFQDRGERDRQPQPAAVLPRGPARAGPWREASPAACAALLLAWARAHEGAAAGALEAARRRLAQLRSTARARARRRSQSRLLLQVDRVVWQLVDPGRDPLLQASIQGLSLDRLRERGGGGSWRLVLVRLSLLDARGGLEAGPGLEPGVVLAAWNPDASWERDDLLRVTASQGRPSEHWVTYEHVDVSIHPLAINLHESLAVALWDYFFPRDRDADKRRSEFEASVRAPRRLGASASAGAHRRARTGPEEEGAPQRGAAAAAARVAAAQRRSRSMDAAGKGAGEEEAPGSAKGASPRTSKASRASQASLAGEPSAASEEDWREGGAAQAHAPLWIRFKHFRTARVHCRLSYRGYPKSFSDLKLVLDGRVYENVEGQWRDVFTRVKWDTVKSVLKSVTGLQGRKFRELLPDVGRNGHEDRREDAEAGSGRRAKVLDALLGSRAARSPRLPRSADADHKRRLIVGDSAPSTSSLASSAGSFGDVASLPGAQSDGALGAPLVVEPESEQAEEDEREGWGSARAAHALLGDGAGGRRRSGASLWVHRMANKASKGVSRLRDSFQD